MKKFYLLVLMMLGGVGSTVYAQCDPPSSIEATYCVGDKANALVTDSDTDVEYAWYTSLADNNPDYGDDGKGRDYKPAGTVSTSTTLYYEKETVKTVGPTGFLPTGGQEVLNDGVNHYRMTFDATLRTEITSYDVIVRLDNPATTYRFGTRFVEGGTTDTTYATWVTGVASSFTSLGSDLYLVTVPVDNIEAPPGTGHVLEFVSSDGTGTEKAVDAMYWWSSGDFKGNNYISGSLDMPNPAYDVDGTVLTPLLIDWNVRVKCDRETITTTESMACCVKVGSSFIVDATTFTPSSTDFPVTLTATGADLAAGMYYYWYDLDGNLIDDDQDLTSIQVSDIGTYTVRVVNEQADINTVACFTNKSALLGIRSVFAPDDITICVGDPITLKGTGAEGNYFWYSTDPLADSWIAKDSAQETTVYFQAAGEYSMIVEGDVLLGNLAYDGKFDNFDDELNFDESRHAAELNFRTTYGIGGEKDGYPEGSMITGANQFRVDNKLKAWSINSTFCENNPEYWKRIDPVSKDTVDRGNIFYADAHDYGTPVGLAAQEAYAAANYMWEQTVVVEPNQTYTFSMDVSEWNKSTGPLMMLLVDGVSIDLFVDGTNEGRTYTPPSGATNGCVWKTVSGTWTSGASPANIKITVAEVAGVNSGHEFAMDEITFSTGRGRQSDEVIVTVDDCRELETRDDTTMCIGGAVPLYMNKNTGFILDWKDQSGNVVATTENSIAYPVANEEYTARAKFPTKNFIKGGDFEDGKLTFTTGFGKISSGSTKKGEYIIGYGDETTLHNSSFNSGQVDHTSGSGQMLLLHVGDSDLSVLSKDIQVSNGSDYVFSTWLKHLHPHVYASGANARDLEFELFINGASVFNYTLTKETDWKNLVYLWNSTVTGTVSVELEVKSVDQDNGFALDDLTIAEIGLEMTDNVTVSANNCFELEAMAPQTVCLGAPVTLSTVKNDGFVTAWEDLNGTVIATTETATVYPMETGDYTVKAKFPVSKLLVNGDFESGSTLDFTTDVTSTNNSQINSGHYFIGTDEQNHSDMQNGQTDHTSGSGDMYVMRFKNGNSIFTKDITMAPNTSYGFSAWLKHMHKDVYSGSFNNSQPYHFELMVDGTSVGSFDLGEITTWENFAAVWTNGGVSNTVTVELIATHNGSDNHTGLALDDIELSELDLEDQSSVTITVDICNTLTLTDEDCDGSDRVISHTTDAVFSGWYDSNDLLVSTDDTLKVSVSSDEVYTAKARVALAALNTNGSFDSDDEGMLQTFSKAPQDPGNNQPLRSPNYGFVTNTSEFNGNHYASFGSASGTGKLLLVNSDRNNTNQTMYESTDLAITANEVYSFDISLAFATKPTELSKFTEFYPIEVYIGTDLIASIDLDVNNSWQSFNYSYQPTTGGNKSIRVVLTQKQGNPYIDAMQYFAYAIDEVHLRPTVEAITETITVEPCSPAAVDSTVTLCADANTGIDLSDYELGMTDNGTSTASGWFNSIADANANTGAIGTTTGLTVADGDQFYLRTTDGGSGNGVAELTFSLTDLPVISVDAVTAMCAESPAVTLSATPVGGTFTGTGVSSGEFDPSTATGSPFTITYSYTDATTTCSNTGTTSITVKPLPVAPSKDTSLVYCQNFTPGDIVTEAEITPSAGGTLVWYNVATNGSSITEPTINTATAGGPTTYYVGQTVDGCESKLRSQIDININEQPTVAISGSGDICFGDSAAIAVDFTGGTAPYSIDATIAGTPVTISGISGDTTVYAKIDGAYNVSSVEDNNSCSSTLAVSDIDVVTTPLIVATKVSDDCNFNTNKFVVKIDVNGGDGAYTYTGATGNATGISPERFESDSITSGIPTDYEIIVTDDSGCPNNKDTIAGTVDCSCPIQVDTYSFSALANDTICNDGSSTSEITVEVSGGINPPYTITILDDDDNPTVQNGAGPIFTFPSLDIDGVYKLASVEDGNCKQTNQGDLTLEVLELPTATVKTLADASICSNNNDSTLMEVDLTFETQYGYDIVITGSGGTVITDASNVTPYQVYLKNDETYTVTAFNDKYCTSTATELVGSAKAEYLTNPTVGTEVYECVDTSTTGGVFQYRVKLPVVAGDGTPTAKEDVTTIGATFSLVGDTIVSSWINEGDVLSLAVFDDNKCDSTLVTNLTKTCSCAETATLSITGDASICEVGAVTTSSLEVTFDDGGTGATSYEFEVQDGDGNQIAYEAAHNGSAYPIASVDTGDYIITVINGICEGNGNSVRVELFESPEAHLSGDSTICNDNVAEATLEIELLKGELGSGVTYELTGSNTGAITENALVTNYTFLNDDFETYTLTKVIDANGCENVAGGVTGTALVDSLISPDTTNYKVVCDPTNDPVTVGQFNYIISFDVAVEDQSTQEVTGATGSFTGNNWISDPIDENTITALSVFDGTSCNPLTIANIQEICSCAETATLSITGDASICEVGAVTTSSLEVTFDDGGTGATSYEFEVRDKAGNQIAYELAHNGSPYPIAGVDTGSYSITILEGTCEGKGVGATVALFETPEAHLSGDSTICNDNVAEATLEIELLKGELGSGVTYELTGSNTGAITETALVTNYTFLNDDFETYTLTKVIDANGCENVAGGVTGTALVDSLVSTDTANYKVVCANGIAVAPFEYQISFDVITEDITTFTTGVTGTLSGTTWTSDPIDEGIITSLILGDDKSCNPLTISNISKTCSCPGEATVKASGLVEICADGSSSVIDVEIPQGIGPWSYDIMHGATLIKSVVDTVGTPGAFKHSFNVQGNSVSDGGKYYVANFTDDNNGDVCPGKAIDTVTITVNALPTAAVEPTSGGKACSGKAAPAITATLTGVGPWTVTYNDGTNDLVPVSENTNGITLNNITTAGKYSIVNLLDVSTGCTAEATGLTGEADVVIAPLPTVDYTGGGTFCETETLTDVTVTLTGIAPYLVTYEVDGVQDQKTINTNAGVLTGEKGVFVITSVLDNYGVDTGCEIKEGDISSSNITGSASFIVEDMPSIPVINSDASEYCQGEDLITLTETTGEGNITWFVSDDNGSSYTQESTQSPVYRKTNAIAGSYNVYVERSLGTACTAAGNEKLKSDDTLSVTVIAPPTPIIDQASDGDVTICFGTEPAILTADNTTGNVVWYKQGETEDFATGTVIELSEKSEAGTYIITEQVGACEPRTSATSVKVEIIEVIVDVTSSEEYIEWEKL